MAEERSSVVRPTAQRRGVFAAIGGYFERHAQTLVAALGRMTRQPLASFMTIMVIAIALALPAAFALLVTNARAATGAWDSAIEVSVYLKRDVSVAKAEQLAQTLRERPGVAGVQFIPADAALKEFREFSGFGPALDALTDNPLPHALIVRPTTDRTSPSAVDLLKRHLQNWPEVDLVQVDTEWVKRFHTMLDVLRRVLGLLAALLAAGVVVIVGNTIRLDIENRRQEIEVTKLVGGSDAFVRRPFLYTGFWYGLVGGALACGLVAFGLWLLQEPVNRLAGLYGSDFRLSGLDPRTMAALLGGGAILGWLGSWLAASRHLRAIEPSG
ncbi:MAG TPA: permease-like cell division protein FtsX [Steroidobacteraceae bacterium]|nr:permease-like cell division protein FtsX [Steroidobacteraceae bacterium]